MSADTLATGVNSSIQFNRSISLATALPELFGGTIGLSGTLDGSGAYQGLFLAAGSLDLNQFTVTGTVAAGGGGLIIGTGASASFGTVDFAAAGAAGAVTMEPGASLWLYASTIDGVLFAPPIGQGATLAFNSVGDATTSGTLDGLAASDVLTFPDPIASASLANPGALDIVFGNGTSLAIPLAHLAAGTGVTVVNDPTVNGITYSGGTLTFTGPTPAPPQSAAPQLLPVDLSGYTAAEQGMIGQWAGSALGGLAPSIATEPTGSGFAPGQGQHSIALASAPAAGATLVSPGGYGALIAAGTNAVTLTPGSLALRDLLLAGNAGGGAIVDTTGQHTLIGGSGDTAITAAPGDAIFTGNGANTVSGATANDTITTGTGHALVQLNGLDSTVYSNGADTIDATQAAGATIVLNAPGATAIAATEVINAGGTDTVMAGVGASTVFANAGGGLYTLAPSTAYYRSTNYFEFVNNTNGTSTIVGAASAQNSVTLFGGSGRLLDFMGGESTNIDLQQGAATMVGGSGGTWIWGGASRDAVFFQGDGFVYYDAQSGRGSVVAAADSPYGPANMLAGPGGEIDFFGPSHDNLLIAYGTGNTTLNGGGASGGNIFFAGAGNTTLFGGSGADTFGAGTGNAVIVAGVGANMFEFTKGFAGGTTTIWNFSAADRVDLYGYGPSAIASQASAGGTTVLTLSDSTRIVLSGIARLNPEQILDH